MSIQLDWYNTIYSIKITGQDLHRIMWCINDHICQNCKIENNEYILHDEYKELNRIKEEISKVYDK